MGGGRAAWFTCPWSCDSGTGWSSARSCWTYCNERGLWAGFFFRRIWCKKLLTWSEEIWTQSGETWTRFGETGGQCLGRTGHRLRRTGHGLSRAGHGMAAPGLLCLKKLPLDNYFPAECFLQQTSCQKDQPGQASGCSSETRFVYINKLMRSILKRSWNGFTQGWI